jgi:hypothetical protein
MEFFLDNENVNIIIKEHSNQNKQPEDLNEFNHYQLSSPRSQSDLFDLSNTSTIKYEIFIKLDDYYLVNNIKIMGEVEEIHINKLKFQNIDNNLWENACFFNPDKKEILIKESDSLSIFCVGLTKCLKIELSMNFDSISNRTLAIPECNTDHLLFSNINSEREINDRIYQNQSMQETLRKQSNNTSANNRKIFNFPKINANIFPNKTNSSNSLCTTTGIVGNIHNNIAQTNIEKQRILFKNLLKSVIKKISVFSQHIYSVPNSTFLLTLLNLKNFFMNKIRDQISNSCQADDNLSWSLYENYLCAMFLTANSMIQARLFIQSCELINKLQNELMLSTSLSGHDANSNSNYKRKNIFFKILLEPQLKYTNELNSLHQSYQDELLYSKKRIALFLTKFEIIKAVCMFEHGHTLAFLDCLKNAVSFYFNDGVINNFTLNHNEMMESKKLKTIQWTKNNEIGSDKFFIQNFLLKNGPKLGEILLILLKDRAEIITVSVLKIIEFIIDYNIAILAPFLNKIIKIIIKIIFPNIHTHNNQSSSDSSNYNISDDFDIREFSFLKTFEEKGIYFPHELLYKYFQNQNNQSRNNLNGKKLFCKMNNLSPLVMKQINYTFDTIINNLDNLSFTDIEKLTKKTSFLLFKILRFHREIDQIILFNILKLLRKMFENINTNIKHLICPKKQNFTQFILNSICIELPQSCKIHFQEILSYFDETSHKKFNPGNNSAKQNLKQKMESTLKLFDRTEIGILLMFIFEKISEECFLFQEREEYMELLNSFNLTLEQILILFKENNLMNREKEFLIFYTFLLLSLSNMIYFSNYNHNNTNMQKNHLQQENRHNSTQCKIKKDVNSFFFYKMNPNFFKTLSCFINNILQFQELSISNKNFFPLFDLTISTLRNIEDVNSELIEINFGAFFSQQYAKLLSFLTEYGLFNENIYYLLKTLPLIQLTQYTSHKHQETRELEFIITFKSIFLIVLKNFSNYFNEDIFELFKLLLEKMKNFLDRELLTEILTSVINKSIFKGNKYVDCVNYLMEVISTSEEYYIILLEIISNNIISYIENIHSFNSEVLKFKEFHLDFIEILEFYKRFLDYLSETIEHSIQNGSILQNYILQVIMKNLLFISDKNNEEIPLVLSLQKCKIDIISNKMNDIICSLFMLTYNSFKIRIGKDDNQDLHKSEIIHLLFALKNIRKLSSIYFNGSNKNSENFCLQSENSKTLSKISNFMICITEILINFQKKLFVEREINNNEFESELTKFMSKDLKMVKIKFFRELCLSIQLDQVKSSGIKTPMNDLMNFLENVIIPKKVSYNY